MLRILLFSALACLVVAPAWAEAPAMAAVGLLRFERGACTGALIAEDLVLTAGHCLLDPEAGDVRRPRRMSFRTGAYPGHKSVKFTVRDLVVHPLFLGAATDEGVARLQHDAGLVRLAEPVPHEVARPIPVVTPAAAMPTFLASYRGGQGERARERLCPILADWSGLATLSCDVRPGESGSPLLLSDRGNLSLVGVLSASTKVKRTEAALALEAAGVIKGLEAMMGPP